MSPQKLARARLDGERFAMAEDNELILSMDAQQARGGVSDPEVLLLPDDVARSLVECHQREQLGRLIGLGFGRLVLLPFFSPLRSGIPPRRTSIYLTREC